MRFLVTGGAGFIGSHFCDSALARGHEVAAYDDMSRGSELFIKDALTKEKFCLVRGDIRELSQLTEAFGQTQYDWVVHFAANADVRQGLERPRRDLDYNTTGTWNVLEAARLGGCKKILFSSTGSVYGEPKIFPTPEDAPFPEQTSLYGASKLAGEALISAYAHGYGFTGLVFRFVSILGPRYSHGHIFDFMRQLTQNPERLKVLGDGQQNKSYLHVDDLMNGLWQEIETATPGFQVRNIGHSESLTVRKSIDTIIGRLGLKPALEFSGGERGWIGDSPRILLDTQRLRSNGWAPKRTLEASVTDTVDYLRANPELLARS